MVRPNFAILSTKVENPKTKMLSLKKAIKLGHVVFTQKTGLSQLNSFQHINLFILIVWNSGKGLLLILILFFLPLEVLRSTQMFTGWMPWFNFGLQLHSLPRSQSI